MTVKELVGVLNAKELNIIEPDRKILGGYCGDFLSFVMGRAEKDCMWFTVMNNINVCAVASLAEVAVVVLCEGVMPDKYMLNAAEQKKINVISTDYTVFKAVKKI